MDAVTYPDAKVVTFIEQHLIPLRIKSDAQPYASDFNVKWTPSLITLDAEGKQHHRTLGFFAPDELIPSLYLGIGKSCFDNSDYDKALVYLNNLTTEYPKSDSAPEAIYIKGVCGYKITDNPKPLREAYETLNAQSPSGAWTKRAYPYRLL
jgi:hypothetical protein